MSSNPTIQLGLVGFFVSTELASRIFAYPALLLVGSWLRPVVRCLRVFVLSPLICRFAYCRVTPMVGSNVSNRRTSLRFRGSLDSSLIPTFVVFGTIFK
jgi:hypothetical protein